MCQGGTIDLVEKEIFLLKISMKSCNSKLSCGLNMLKNFDSGLVNGFILIMSKHYDKCDMNNV